MKIILKAGTIVLNLIYCIYKLCPSKDRIVFVSRQSDEPSPDCVLLSKAIREKDQKIEIIKEFRCIPDSFIGKIKYAFYMVGRQMHLFATAKVIILDGYCILASVLNHKKNLKIVQMWHAMGALKQFGYAAIGKGEGQNPDVSKILRMHRNYDYVICSCEECSRYYEEAFRVPREKIVTATLPRVDIFTDPKLKKIVQDRIYRSFPVLKEKQNILYVPTFRKNEEMGEKVKELIESVDFEYYNLIVKLHPLTKESVELGRSMECESYSALELLNVADYVISDYSAFIFEAAAAEKPLFLYTYDLEKYMDQRGFFIDFCQEMPAVCHKEAKELIDALEREDYNIEKIKAFADKYVENRCGCSQKLADFICTLYNENINE